VIGDSGEWVEARYMTSPSAASARIGPEFDHVNLAKEGQGV